MNKIYNDWITLIDNNKNVTTLWNKQQVSQFFGEMIPNFQKAYPAKAEYAENICKRYFELDCDIVKRHNSYRTTLYKEIMGTANASDKKNYFFVTVGFDDKLGEERLPAIMKSCLNSFLKTKNIHITNYVFEKFRKDDTGKIYIHHHIHMLCDTDYPKSKVVDYLYQKCKKYVSAKNFVDLRNNLSKEQYKEYINGNKKTDKLECIKLDIEWRIKFNL